MNISFSKNGLGILLGILLLGISGCKKEVVEVYNIETVTLYSSASEKKNLKTDEQFIAILYSDLFGESIGNTRMNQLNNLYISFGDKGFVIDLIIRSLLVNEDADIPSEISMRANPDTFIEETYKRFLVRYPTEQEKWFLLNLIDSNEDLSPTDIYYSLLTSEEYRYY